MRRPPAIFGRRSDFGELLAAGDFLTNAKPCQSLRGEMPVKRKKLLCFASGLCKRVPQNHDRPVIEWRGIVRHGMYNAVDGSTDRAARSDLEIDSQMNRAPLIGGIFARAKQRRGIDRPRFVVSPDAHGSTGAFHFREKFVG